MAGYDPLELSQRVETKVARGSDRKYYRFRPARFYGGVATADCVGCNLMCRYCWSKSPRENPGEVGTFHTPEQVADQLVRIADRKGLSQVRVSGNEPTIGEKHLLSVLDLLRRSGLLFILETNGLLLGHRPDYVRALDMPDLHVRVSLKGCHPEHFFRLTGAIPEAFRLQLDALKNLLESGVSCHPAVITDLSTHEDITILRETLADIDPSLERRLELEALIRFPHVRANLRKWDLD